MLLGKLRILFALKDTYLKEQQETDKGFNLP